jgi:hypothetical protein
MRSLVVLVAMIVATAASALPAGSHEWYTGLRSPDGMSCCNERDCRPVAYRVNRDTGREEIQANGAWYPVEYDKVLPFSSPMAATTPAGATRREDLTFAASCFPAWHPSPSKVLACITPDHPFQLKWGSLRPPSSSLPGLASRLARTI